MGHMICSLIIIITFLIQYCTKYLPTPWMLIREVMLLGGHQVIFSMFKDVSNLCFQQQGLTTSLPIASARVCGFWGGLWCSHYLFQTLSLLWAFDKCLEQVVRVPSGGDDRLGWQLECVIILATATSVLLILRSQGIECPPCASPPWK